MEKIKITLVLNKQKVCVWTFHWLVAYNLGYFIIGFILSHSDFSMLKLPLVSLIARLFLLFQMHRSVPQKCFVI